ncbi:MAG: nuclear transport factor 2 family protein [Deltaproteobacteria bacterium]|nr:nuclear transport factor 2 family protein [Deltaproteobacteria bacterium]
MADFEARLAALEGRVRELQDRNEIQELRFSYHLAVNEKKPEMIPDLFAENGEIDFAHLGKAVGKANVAAFYKQALSELVPFVKQFIHNHIITVNGDSGSGVSYLEAKPIFNGESFLVAARFDDDYVRENGRWKFRKMTLLPYFMVPLKEGWAGPNKIQMVRK